MTTGVCSRCGASGTVEYGADGMMYCSSCAFYGLNKQCWRCRMYLPASELQQYRGQLACPNCIQDLRAETVKAEEHPPEKLHLDVISYPEQCERCGRDLKGRVYIWNGKRLCKSCVEDEQQKWGTVGGGPMAAPYKITLGPERRRKKMSLIESLISDFLHLTGIRRRKGLEIIVVSDKMPIGLAKPMAEKPMLPSRKDKESPRPQAEGIMALENPDVLKQNPQQAKAGGQKTNGAAAATAAQAAVVPAQPDAGELSRVVPAKRAQRKKAGKEKREGAGAASAGPKKKKQ